jgi:G:T/U-mismatch repair DNA glycosylase
MMDEKHVDRYAELPEETRKFVEELRPKDIQLLQQSIEFMRSVVTVGRFIKWSLVGIVGTFVGAVMFGEALAKIWNWLTWTPKP